MNRQGFSLLLAEVRSGFDRLRRDVVYACYPIDVARAQVALEALEMTAKTPAERQAERKARELAAGHAQPNCRYEVESQLGEEIWDALHSAYSEPLYDQAAIDAAVAAERERLRVMLTAHLDQTVMSHHVTLAECHAARNALQLVLDQWA